MKTPNHDEKLYKEALKKAELAKDGEELFSVFKWLAKETNFDIDAYRKRLETQFDKIPTTNEVKE